MSVSIDGFLWENHLGITFIHHEVGSEEPSEDGVGITVFA